MKTFEKEYDIKMKSDGDSYKEMFEFPTLEEFLDRTHRMNFYHPDLDTFYEVGFNPNEPRVYKLRKGLTSKDVPVNIDNLEEWMRKVGTDFDSLSDKEKQMMDGYFHTWLYNNDCGKDILTSYYNNFLVQQRESGSMFIHSSLYEDEYHSDFTDVVMRFKKRDDFHRNKWSLEVVLDNNPIENETINLRYDKHISTEKINEHFQTRRWKHTPYEKVGRNDKCPCGSGLKFKKCCLN